MSIGIFITPASVWRPPVQATAPPAHQQQPPRPTAPDWCDFAAEERWEEAILAYLRADWRKTFKMWSVINEIVAESRQQTRFDTRAATFEVLAEVMRLRRERVIFRYKRKWIASLDSGSPIIPLEDLPRHCGKRERTRPA
jgi:hypothetical protein